MLNLLLAEEAATLIKADDTWVLWTILIVFAAISIYCEQHYKWAEKLSGPVIGLILAVAATNFRLIPAVSPSGITAFLCRLPCFSSGRI